MQYLKRVPLPRVTILLSLGNRHLDVDHIKEILSLQSLSEDFRNKADTTELRIAEETAL
jgi:hypothetical protein